MRPPPPAQMAALLARLRQGEGLNIVATGSSVAAMGTSLGAVVCSSDAPLNSSDGAGARFLGAVTRETHRRPQGDTCALRCGDAWR